jgi:hypothetical protein
VYLSIVNSGPAEVIVFDMHANTYHSTSGSGPPLASVAHRERIELLDTNSIGATGRVIRAVPGESVAIDLGFEISRLEGFAGSETPTQGTVFSLFGLFADLRAVARRRVVEWRLPSDAIYCFQDANNGHFVWISDRNLHEYAQRHKGSMADEYMFNGFRDALKAHRALRFRRHPQPTASHAAG